MYITETTNNVRNLIEILESMGDISKLKFVIYVFGQMNNNQINSKNEVNPDLIEDNELIVFNLNSIGVENSINEQFLQYCMSLYNKTVNTKDLYELNGNIIGLKFNEIELTIISYFEKLNFIEKLDVFSEIFIRLDNETYFKNINNIYLNTNLDGYTIAKLIQKLKVGL